MTSPLGPAKKGPYAPWRRRGPIRTVDNVPDPRPRPRYRLALVGAFAAFSLVMVGLGVRLGTASIMGGADRGPAEAAIEAAGAVIHLEAAPRAPEVSELIEQLQADGQIAARGAGAQQGQARPSGEAVAAAPEPAATKPAPAPAPQPATSPLPVPLTDPAPAPPPPPSSDPTRDPALAPVTPVLDALLGPPILPGL